MRALWIPLLIPFVVAAGYFGWSWFQVKYTLAQLQQIVSPYGVISYQSIPLPYKGHYLVEGFAIELAQSRILIRAEEVLLTTEDWQSIALLGTPFGSGEIPKASQIRFQNVTLEGDLEKTSDPFSTDLVTQSLIPGCFNSAGEINELPLPSGPINIDLSYHFTPSNQIVNLAMASTVERVGALRFTADALLKAEALNLHQLNDHAAKLLSLTLDYRDQGYNQQLIGYCSEQAGVPIDEYRRLLTERLPKGLPPEIGQKIRPLYSEMYKTGAEYQLAADFEPPVELVTGRFDQFEVLNGLSLRARINQHTFNVFDLIPYFSHTLLNSVPTAEGDIKTPILVDEPLLLEPENDQVEPAQNSRLKAAEELRENTKNVKSAAFVADQSVITAASDTSVKQETTYQPIAVARIGSSVTGRFIRVNTFNGREIEGEVLRVFNNQLLVRQEIGSGTADIPLLFKHIQRAEIK